MRVAKLRGTRVTEGEGLDEQFHSFYVFPVVILQQIRSMDIIS
jgi:hypothetical protein